MEINDFEAAALRGSISHVEAAVVVRMTGGYYHIRFRFLDGALKGKTLTETVPRVKPDMAKENAAIAEGHSLDAADEGEA